MSKEFESKLERPLKPGEVLIYSEENHQGQEWLVTNDTSSLDDDFSVASFRIGPKTGVTFFSDRKYEGISQNLTAELISFKDSKLQDQNPKSLKIWLAAGKAFTGYWAIETVEGRYLSVHPDTGVLTTSSTVSDSEAFRIKNSGQAGPGRRKAAFQVRGTPAGELLPARQPHPLSIKDLQIVTTVDEQEAGFRKFSLLVGGQWICYHPKEDRFGTSSEAQDRTIFCQSIKIAEDETQIGRLDLGEVALFENPCYWGKAWVFYKDYADFNRVVDLNDEVSSIQLGPLTGATIYREAQFTTDDPSAGKQDIISNISSLAKEQVGEDQISSIDLWRITTPGDLGITFTCSLSQDFRGAGDTFEEYSAYRTTIRLPPTVETVDVWTTDRTTIEVDNQTYVVDEDNYETLQPNMIQCLVITTDAVVSSNGEAPRGTLRAPGLKIRTETMLPHERIVIFPDQEVHARLADLKDDELWHATFKDQDGNPQHLIKDRSPQKQKDTANTQNMITKIMSTVKYSKNAYGENEQSIAPEELHGQYWALDFSTYRVKASTLYVREGPGTNFKRVGFLRKDDIVEALEFNRDASWIRLRRLSDGLMGWSARIYMDKIADRPLTGDQYRVTASRLHVREGPGREFRSLGAIQNKEIITAIGVNDTGTWRQICRGDGLVGWASARYMALVLPSDDIVGISYRLSGNMKVREGPGTNFKTTGYLQTDDVVEALEADAEGTWLRIRRTTDGLTGWAWSRYLVRITLPLSTSQESQMVSEPSGRSATRIDALTPSPDVIALSPDVRFHEASKEDVQALLALAESPDTDLAQGFFGDISRAFKKAVSFVVAEVKEGVAVIIKYAKKAVKWVIDTAEKAVAVVEGIFEKIGAVIEEIIKWLRFIFEWKDIIHTRDYLRENLNNSLDYMGQRLTAGAREPVSNFFKNQRHLITSGLDQAIDKLGGSSTNVSSGTSSGLADVIEVVDWILSKVIGGVTQIFGASSIFDMDYPDDADEKLRPYWEETLAKGAGMVSVIPEDLSNVITSLVKDPDKPQQAVVALLRMFRDQLNKLLDMGEDIVLGLFDLAAYLIEKIKAILDAHIRIPFISDLIEWVGKLLGKNWSATLGFSLLDVATLILAVPVTSISKARLGRAPFKNVPALAASTDEWSITAGVAGYLGALVAAPLDMMPETDVGLGTFGNVLESFSLVFAITGVVASWGPDMDDSQQHDELWWSLLAYDVIVLVLDFGSFLYGFKSKKVERFKRGEHYTIIIASILGGVHLGLLIAKDIKDGNELEILPDCLATLPEICSALRLSKNAYVSVAFGIIDGIAGGTSLGMVLAG